MNHFVLVQLGRTSLSLSENNMSANTCYSSSFYCFADNFEHVRRDSVNAAISTSKDSENLVIFHALNVLSYLVQVLNARAC